MKDQQRVNAESTRLPTELLDRLTKPFARFLAIEAAAGGILLLFTVAALVLSNSPWAHSFLNVWETQIGFQVGAWEFAHTLRDWINDGLMTLFFLLVSLGLKREFVSCELRSPRMAALSMSAALGDMLVPAALNLMIQAGQHGQHGWGTVMTTDTAFVFGCLALLRSRIPQSLRVFLISLAVVDDIGAIFVLAIGYSSHIA
jgi:NhaA family Na+:H+ antiporter